MKHLHPVGHHGGGVAKVLALLAPEALRFAGFETLTNNKKLRLAGFESTAAIKTVYKYISSFVQVACFFQCHNIFIVVWVVSLNVK